MRTKSADVKNKLKPIKQCNCRWMVLAVWGTICVTHTILAADSSTNQPPPFKQLRYDESYLYLRDSTRRGDYLDAFKFIV